jgi:hypothetical protein
MTRNKSFDTDGDSWLGEMEYVAATTGRAPVRTASVFVM